MADPEAIHHPPHYLALGARCTTCGTPIECITVVERMRHNIAAAVGYLWRAPFKNGDGPVEDLRKAAKHIEFEIDLLERDQLACLQDAISRAAPPQEPRHRDVTVRFADAPATCTFSVLRVHLGEHALELPADPALETGELADRAAIALGLDAAAQHALVYQEHARLHAVHRRTTVGELSREGGHAARRYVLLTCA